jgi:diguanylate cyclase (GGDEF)-like protein/PAS domain S-box-containing protein
VDRTIARRISLGGSSTRLRLPYGSGMLFTLGVLALGYMAWLALGGGGSGHRGLVSAAVALPFGLFAGLLALRTALRLRDDRRARGAWLVLCVGLFAFWLGDVLWLRSEAVSKSLSFPSWADGAYLSAYPLFLGALFLLTRPKAGWARRLKFGLNAATMLVGGGLAIWYFIPSLAGGTGGFGPALAALYPAGDLLLVLAIATLTLRKAALHSRLALFSLAAGMIFGLVTDLTYGYQGAPSFHHAGGLADGGHLLSLFFLALAAEFEFRFLGAGSGRAGTTDMRRASLLPYLATLVGSAVLLWVMRGKLGTQEGQVAAAVVVLILLAVAHQATAVRESNQLREQSAARRSEERFEALVKHASDIVTVMDGDSTIAYQTPSLKNVLGYEPASLAGSRFVDLVHLEDRALVISFLADLGSHPGTSRHSSWRMRDSRGGWRPTETVGINLLDDARVRGLVLTTRDISERKALEKQLVRQAFHDPLTGLPNRALFYDRLAQASAQADREQFSVAVLLLDLDDFKNVNDSWGHLEGDRLLVLVAERLQHILRRSDTAARLGGDEFVILVGSGPSSFQPLELAKRILAHLREPYRLSAAEVLVTASIGITIREPGGRSGEDVLRDADVALYAAKSRGKDCCRLFGPEMFEGARAQVEREAEDECSSGLRSGLGPAKESGAPVGGAASSSTSPPQPRTQP